MHLTLRNGDLPVAINLVRYTGPESRCCPAGDYEFVNAADGSDRLRINRQTPLAAR